MSVFLVSAALDIFQSLIGDLDTEGRYLFLNAIANQLRYPNSHTHYFSFILLYSFAEANQVKNFVLIVLHYGASPALLILKLVVNKHLFCTGNYPRANYKSSVRTANC